jgi:hypothetical protein
LTWDAGGRLVAVKDYVKSASGGLLPSQEVDYTWDMFNRLVGQRSRSISIDAHVEDE